MKRYAGKLGSARALCLLVIGIMLFPSLAKAQATGSIHGHVQNAIGQPVTKGDVKLTTDKTGDAKTRKFPYSFPLDANGDFKGTGIAPGSYLAVVYQEDKSLDFIDSLDVKANIDAVANFDMTRPAYVDKMTPEEKKNLEEYKKKNSEAVAANSKIANLNTALVQARADTKAGNYDAAITSMQQATTQKPDEAILWVALGDAQAGSADAASKTAKAAGKPTNDPTITSKYTDAATSYKKAIDLGASAKKPSPETTAAAENQLGQVLAKSGNTKDAADAYDAAAKAQPDHAGMYLFNEAATLYNAGKTDDAAVAADKAIAADPNRADAYYIKGQALIGKASVDSKTQKITAPPGCVEAYQKYLDLSPTGPRADEVKSILTGIGAQVKSTYKAGKK
jgi:tetratricopeptide (TPR) repeat protein